MRGGGKDLNVVVASGDSNEPPSPEYHLGTLFDDLALSPPTVPPQRPGPNGPPCFTVPLLHDRSTDSGAIPWDSYDHNTQTLQVNVTLSLDECISMLQPIASRQVKNVRNVVFKSISGPSCDSTSTSTTTKRARKTIPINKLEIESTVDLSGLFRTFVFSKIQHLTLRVAPASEASSPMCFKTINWRSLTTLTLRWSLGAEEVWALLNRCRELTVFHLDWLNQPDVPKRELGLGKSGHAKFVDLQINPQYPNTWEVRELLDKLQYNRIAKLGLGRARGSSDAGRPCGSAGALELERPSTISELDVRWLITVPGCLRVLGAHPDLAKARFCVGSIAATGQGRAAAVCNDSLRSLELTADSCVDLVSLLDFLTLPRLRDMRLTCQLSSINYDMLIHGIHNLSKRSQWGESDRHLLDLPPPSQGLVTCTVRRG